MTPKRASRIQSARSEFFCACAGYALRNVSDIRMTAPSEALKDITALLPGAEAPTILPLHGRPGHFAVHAVCQESVFWETLQKLKAAGASAILVVPIEKMML